MGSEVWPSIRDPTSLPHPKKLINDILLQKSWKYSLILLARSKTIQDTYILLYKQEFGLT